MDMELDDDTWIATVAVDSIDPDYPSMVKLDQVEIALCRTEDGVFALGNICTHAFARLSDGHVEEGQVFCPLHMGSFDLRTGAAVAAPCYDPVKSYATKVENGTVFVCPIERPLAV